MLKTTSKLLLATVLAIATVNAIELRPPQQTSYQWLTLEQAAQARSSGGRSGGGSFSRGSSRSSGSRGSSSRSRSYERSPAYSSGSSYTTSGGYHRGGGTTLGSTGTAMVFGILFFGISGIILLALISSALKNKNNQGNATSTYHRERDNDKVTISQLQIALLASATDVQSGLSDLSLRVDTSTEEGLRELLQASIMILLRHTEYWRHGSGHAQTVNINQAESIFEQLSLEQRSKLTQETLSNVRGKIQAETVIAPEDESAMYIVVTLLVGTAHDQPQFQKLSTVEDFETALKRLASTPPDYLLKLELLWSPQAENDSLTYDEFITEYTEMLEFV